MSGAYYLVCERAPRFRWAGVMLQCMGLSIGVSLMAAGDARLQLVVFALTCLTGIAEDVLYWLVVSRFRQWAVLPHRAARALVTLGMLSTGALATVPPSDGGLLLALWIVLCAVLALLCGLQRLLFLHGRHPVGCFARGEA